ncbi:hypothetical protein GEMRC1_006407 [Eukaryota sp. GEM-RC1]
MMRQLPMITSIVFVLLINHVVVADMSCSSSCSKDFCHDSDSKILFIPETTFALSLCPDIDPCETQFRHVIIASHDVVITTPSFTVLNSLEQCQSDSIVSFHNDILNTPITIGPSSSDDPFRFIYNLASMSLTLQPLLESNSITLLVDALLNISFPITVKGEVRLLHNLTLFSTFNPSLLTLKDDVTIDFTGGSLVLNKFWNLMTHSLTLESLDFSCHFILAITSFNFSTALHTNCVYQFSGSGEVFLKQGVSYTYPAHSPPYLIYLEESASLSLDPQTLTAPEATVFLNTTGSLRISFMLSQIAYLKTVHLVKGLFDVGNQQTVVNNLILGSEGVLYVSDSHDLSISESLLIEQNQVPYNLPLVFHGNVVVEIATDVTVTCEELAFFNFHSTRLLVKGKLLLSLVYNGVNHVKVDLDGGIVECVNGCPLAFIDTNGVLSGSLIILELPTDSGSGSPLLLEENTSITWLVKPAQEFNVICLGNCTVKTEGQWQTTSSVSFYTVNNASTTSFFILNNVDFFLVIPMTISQLYLNNKVLKVRNNGITADVGILSGEIRGGALEIKEKLMIEGSMDFSNMRVIISCYSMFSPSISFFSTVLEVSGSGHVIFPIQENTWNKFFSSSLEVAGLIEIGSYADLIDVTLIGGHLNCLTCILNLTVVDGTVTGNVSLQSINFQSNDDIYHPLYVANDSILTLHDTLIEYLDVECVSRCNILLSGIIEFHNSFRMYAVSEDAVLMNPYVASFNRVDQNLQVRIPFFNHGYLSFQSNHELTKNWFGQSNSPQSYVQSIFNTGQLFFNSILLSISALVSSSNVFEENSITFQDSEILVSNFNIDTSNLIVYQSRIWMDLFTISNSSFCLFESNVTVTSRGIIKDNCLFYNGTLISKGVLEMDTTVVYLQSSTLVFEGTVKFPSKFKFQTTWGTSLVIFNSNDIIHYLNDSLLYFYCDCSFDTPIIFINSIVSFSGVVSFSNRVSLFNSTLIFNDNVYFTASSVVDGDSNSFFMPNETLRVMGTWRMDSLLLTSKGSFYFSKSAFFNISHISVSHGCLFFEQDLNLWSISSILVMGGEVSVVNSKNVVIESLLVYSGSIIFSNLTSLELIDTTFSGGISSVPGSLFSYSFLEKCF